MTEPKQPSLSERPLSERIRNLVLVFKLTADDLAERRGAQKMREAVLELVDAERAELERELGELIHEWRSEAAEYKSLPTDSLNMGDLLNGCADALAALLARRGMA